MTQFWLPESFYYRTSAVVGRSPRNCSVTTIAIDPEVLLTGKDSVMKKTILVFLSLLFAIAVGSTTAAQETFTIPAASGTGDRCGECGQSRSLRGE